MSPEQFKEKCRSIIPNVFFREEGKHGWTSVENILNESFKSDAGPHWIDACVPKSQYLLGYYNFNSGEAKFFLNKHYNVFMIDDEL